MFKKTLLVVLLLLAWVHVQSTADTWGGGVSGGVAYAQPAKLKQVDSLDGPTVIPGSNGSSGKEPLPEPEPVRRLWLKAMPDYIEWAVGLGSFFAFLIVVYALYRALLPRHVARINAPVSLRANLIMLCGLVFILWHLYWFVWHLEAFGILTAAVLAVAGLAIMIIGVLSRR